MVMEDKNKVRKKTCAVAVLANHILEDYCTYSPSHLFWRQRSFRRAIASSVHAAAVGPPSLHISFRRATASTIHAAVGSVWHTEILPASDSELRLRRSTGVRLAYSDPSGERQRAPFTPQQWGPPGLHRSFRRATANTVHAAVGSV